MFDDVAATEGILFQYPYDGCDVRATQMEAVFNAKWPDIEVLYIRIRLGEGEDWLGEDDWLVVDLPDSKMTRFYFDLGVEGALLAGPESVFWKWHVAPAMKVSDEGSDVYWIIDPALFDEAVPLALWVDKVNSRGLRYSLEPYGSMWLLDPDRLELYDTYRGLEDLCKQAGACRS